MSELPPSAADPEPSPPSLLIRLTKGVSWVGVGLLASAWIGEALVLWLDLTHRLPQARAAALHSECLAVAVVGASVAMAAAAVRTGAIERRRSIERERFRAEAEAARREAFHRREAARVAAEEAAVAQAAAIARAREAGEARAAAIVSPSGLTGEQLAARAKAEAARLEEQARIDQAILTGTRVGV